MTSNQIAFYKAKNEKEHYERSDSENQRHNFATESLNAQDLSIKDWANRANIQLGFTNSEINRQHYERSDAINQAHYERGDYNNQVKNQLTTDQLMLDAINTLGEPVAVYTLDGSGQKVEVESPPLVLGDYYDSTIQQYSFDTKPLSLEWLKPATVIDIITGLGSVAGNAAKVWNAAKGRPVK